VSGAKDLLSATEGWIQQASQAEWDPSRVGSISFYGLVLRSVLVKQYESMLSVLTLEDCSQGFSAVALLRAMCEELIWAKYLGSRGEEDASRIVEALGYTKHFLLKRHIEFLTLASLTNGRPRVRPLMFMRVLN
jgi:hypothetical protein